MTKTINEIRNIIQQMNVTDPFKVAEVLLDLLEKLADHESLINRMDGGLTQITDAQRSVPVEWYRRAAHSHLKVYRELLALGGAVNEHADASVFRDRQHQLLAEDSEYQRLLAEEQPQIVMKGLEDILAVQKGSPGIQSVDYTLPHVFDLDKQTGLPHVQYRICKCGMSEDNAIHI